MNSRKSSKATFDRDKQLRTEKLEIGDLVLSFQFERLGFTRSREEIRQQMVSYLRTYKIPEHAIFYFLEELGGTHLAGIFAGSRLKNILRDKS